MLPYIHNYSTAYQSCFVPLANRICYADSVVYVCVFTYIHLSLFTLFYMVWHTDMNFDLATFLYNAYISLPYTYVRIRIYGTTEVYQYMSLSNAYVYGTLGVRLGKSLNVNRRLVLTLSHVRECLVMTWVTMGCCLN